MKKAILALMAVMALASVTPALAEKPAHAGKHRATVTEKIRWNNDRSDKVAIRIGGNEQNVIRNYLKQHYGTNCPPGLAKKNNGCLPPGQAKKYRVGGRLGAYGSLPEALAQMLGAPPRGTFYAMVDKDVLLVSEGTKLVLDAVTLLSAVR